MPGDEDDDDPIITAGQAPAGQPTQPTNGPATAAPAGPQGGQGEAGTQTIKTSDWKRIKEEQRAKGRQQATADLEARARAVGFASFDDALKAAEASKKQPPITTVQTQPTQPQGAPTMAKPAKTTNNDQAEKDRIVQEARDKEERSKVRKQWRSEERRRRELEQRLEAKDAEIALREECYHNGVKDVDYTIRLLTRALEGKTAEEIATFDRKAFYADLKKDKPYLFGETVVAATTGAGGEVKTNGNGSPAPGTAPAPPAPGSTAIEQGDGKKFDARTAKPEEVQARLRQLGLNPHL